MDTTTTTWPDAIMCIVLVIGVCVIVYLAVKHTDIFKN